MSLLSPSIVGYHFCQADNGPTCQVPEFVHSLAAQLSQAPQLAQYFQILQSDTSLLDTLSLTSCTSSPTTALVRGILEPLSRTEQEDVCIIVVDGLCEAEQHRPDHGDTIATFLANHLQYFPAWLRLVCTVRSAHSHCIDGLGLHTVR